jgi:hypothetical protein
LQWTEGKNQLEPGEESVGDVAMLSHCSLLRNPSPKPTGVLEHFVQENPPFGSPFFEAFPSDRIHEATKYVSLYFFIHSSNFSK